MMERQYYNEAKKGGCGYRPMEKHLVTEPLDSNQPTIKSHEWHALHRLRNAETEYWGLFSWGLWSRLIPTSCSRHHHS
jgi:hypothetical protein